MGAFLQDESLTQYLMLILYREHQNCPFGHNAGMRRVDGYYYRCVVISLPKNPSLLLVIFQFYFTSKVKDHRYPWCMFGWGWWSQQGEKSWERGKCYDLLLCVCRKRQTAPLCCQSSRDLGKRRDFMISSHVTSEGRYIVGHGSFG